MIISNIKRIRENADRKSKEYFDSEAEGYEEDYNYREPKRCYEETLREVGRYKKNICVLDVGCGTGAMLRKICDNYSDVRIAEGIDISDAMINQAKKLSKNYPIKFLVGTLEKANLKKEKYNVILCMHSFHHYQNPLKMLKNMKKILNREGRLIIVENRKKGWERIHFNYNLIKNDFPCGDLWTYSKYELTFLAKIAGFKKVGYKKCGMQSFMLVCQMNENPNPPAMLGRIE